MQIRTKLTIQFIILVACIILFCFSIIYASLYQNRKNEFYRKIEHKADATAELYFNYNSIDSASLRGINDLMRFPESHEDITIYNKEGNLIYSTVDTIDYHISKTFLAKIKDEQSVEFVVGKYRVLGKTYPGKYDGAIIVAGDVDWESLAKNAFLFRLLTILYGVSIIIVSIAGRLFAQRALAPLSDVISQVNNLPIESLEARLKVVNARDEIGRLAQTFNMLLVKIQNSIKLQKIFLSAVSHEMKNPLTSITSQLQVLQLKRRSEDEYQQTIESVLEDLAHLNKTTIDLIDFSRLSYEMNLGVVLQNVRIDDVVWHCKEYYAKLNPLSTIKIRLINLPQNQDGLIIQANEALLKIALLNIIDNACKFSSDNSVKIEFAVQNHSIDLAFTDNGQGMTLSEQEHIFEPFYRADKTSNISGHGLGLAIVKRITDFHKAKIMVNSSKNQGTTFVLKFPKKF